MRKGKAIAKAIAPFPLFCTECGKLSPQPLLKKVHSVGKAFCSETCWKLFKSREFEK